MIAPQLLLMKSMQRRKFVKVRSVGDEWLPPHGPGECSSSGASGHTLRTERVRAARDARTYQGIRIYFDTQFVNDDNTCKRAGQKITDINGVAETCTQDDVLTADKVSLDAL
jgi:hypothetical protein